MTQETRYFQEGYWQADDATFSLSLKALTWGVSVYTTFRWPCPSDSLMAHLNRLSKDATTWLGCDELTFPSVHSLAACLTTLPKPENADLRIRLTVVPMLEHYTDWWQQQPLNGIVLLQSSPCSKQKSMQPEHGFNVETVPFSRSWPLIKHGQLLDVLQWRRQRPQSDEILLVNPQGKLTEAGFANLWMLTTEGELITPDPYQHGCLPGLTSQWIFNHVNTLKDWQARYATITLPALLSASGAFLSSAMLGLQPIRSVNQQALIWTTETKQCFSHLQAHYRHVYAEMLSNT